jgi:hypothetical protein
MDEEYGKPRDVHSDLTEITTRLGDPDATHRTNPGSVAWRLILGIFLVLAFATFHYFYWTDNVPWPNGAQPWMRWVLLAGIMFVGPGLGFYLITFAIRGLKLWVLLYPTGLFIWHRGRVVGFPWDEIVAIQFSGLPGSATWHRTTGGDSLPQTAWFDLSRSRHKIFGTTIVLTRADGEQASLSSTLTEFAELGGRVQEETFRRLFPIKWALLRDGGAVSFGQIACDGLGIRVGRNQLSWSELKALQRDGDKLEVKKKGKKKPWAKCDVIAIANLHVLMGFVSVMRRGGDHADHPV